MTTTQLQILLAERPVGLPGPSTFETQRSPIPDPEDGQVEVRVAVLSIDPAMRGWMDDRKSYVPPVPLGGVMRALGVGTVTRSRDPRFAPGDRVSGLLGWQEVATVRGRDLRALPPGSSWSLALGPLGMVGMTAYFGLLDVGQPAEGDTLLVSGGAGAVGSLVGQIGRIRGCRVVGIAGSPEKCAWLTDELGFHAAIDYKATPDLHGAIREACPDGVNIYFDNVGGPMLDTVLRSIAPKARIVICGAISQYNSTDGVRGPSNYLALLVQRARMEGFVVFDYAPRYGEAVREMAGWLESGELHHREHVVDGLENAPDALRMLFDGSNTGKLMVRVANEEDAGPPGG